MSPQPDPNQVNNQANAIRAYLARNPNDGQAWLSLAQMLAHNPVGPELSHAIGQSIQLLPDNPQVWLLAAKMQLPENGLTAVLNWLDDAARENPSLTAPRLAMAQLLLDRGKFNEAARRIEQALKLQSESAEYWGILAHCRLMEGEYAAAISTATRAFELDDKLFDALITRAEAYRRALRWQSALDDFEAVKQHRRGDPQLLNKIGVCLIRMEKIERAESHFKRALEIDPGFTLAKLNIGLLCATRMQADEAVSHITDVLEDPTLDEPSRLSAQTTLDILHEQKRLATYLRQAVRTDNIAELHHALQQVPPSLARPDHQSVTKLRELAALCQDFPFHMEDFRYTANTINLPFIEACAQCKIESDPELMRELSAITSGPIRPDSDKRHHELANASRLIRERQNIAADVLQGLEGEAWLRYWHARLLDQSPERQPGQYKAIPNTIGHEMPTPPERVTGTHRLLLAELQPEVPGGLASAVFMYLAMNVIHGFGDGNGRLSRFLLSWECESAGMEAIIVPLELRLKLAQALQRVIFKGELETLVAVLREAHAGTDALLRQLNETNGHQP